MRPLVRTMVRSACFEEEHRCEALPQKEVDETACFEGHVTAEVLANNAVPGRVVLPIKLSFDVGRYVLFLTEQLASLDGCVHCVHLHILRHIRVLHHISCLACHRQLQLMGCGGGAKATSNTVREAPRPSTLSKPARQYKPPHGYARFKLEPEVLDGFAKLLKRGSEPPPRPAESTKSSEPAKPVQVEYQAPNVTNPFGDLLKGEQQRTEQTRLQATLEERRYSPEPPRPDSVSSDEENRTEDDERRAARLERERIAKEEADHLAVQRRREQEEIAAGRKGQITGMESEAQSILSKYQA